jgi:hypothetical protein
MVKHRHNLRNCTNGNGNLEFTEMKGSVSLSVNAIVILVLGLAMMGFGLFVINELRDNSISVWDEIFNRHSFLTEADSENLVAVSKDISLRKNGGQTLRVQVYNDENIDFIDVLPQVIKCSSEGVGSSISTVGVPRTISPGTTEEFLIRFVSEGANPGSYICDIGVTDGTTAITEQFNIRII